MKGKPARIVSEHWSKPRLNVNAQAPIFAIDRKLISQPEEFQRFF
jgi:hypothetical protein